MESREAMLASVRATRWDVVVIGGGITGAGVAREAVRRGLRTLLIDQADYSWGTSSRSSKMVHGGIRYLSQGDIMLTWHSLSERERLLREAPGLVSRMGYHFAHFRRRFPGRWLFQILLTVYDLLARIRDYRYFRSDSFLARFPGHVATDLTGASRYTDAVVDDSRLVLRVLDEADADGLVRINYVQAVEVLRDGQRVAGLRLRDVADAMTALPGADGRHPLSEQGGALHEVSAACVINATGAWADRLRGQLVSEVRVRPLRGSHLVFAAERLPVTEALLCHHPVDQRVMFIYPWERRTIVGTTDLDHRDDLNVEAVLDQHEVDYLLAGANARFPQARVSAEDVIATWSGVRPIIAAGDGSDPSKERRSHAVWDNDGLITVTGGKLTTFRLIALDALKAAARHLGRDIRDDGGLVFAPVPEPVWPARIVLADRERLSGRYGRLLADFLAQMPPAEWRPVHPGLGTWLAELRWACRHEQVVHLDDLLLRRVRLGLLLPEGGLDTIAELDAILAEELGWDSERIADERARFRTLWRRYYGLPS